MTLKVYISATSYMNSMFSAIILGCTTDSGYEPDLLKETRSQFVVYSMQVSCRTNPLFRHLLNANTRAL